MLRTSAFLFLLSGALAAQPRALTLKYVFLSNGAQSGTEIDTYNADKTIDTSYEYNDRGRGPKISGHYAIASNGWPSRVDLTGVDYLKAPVDEHFLTDTQSARWKSTSEDGTAPKSAGFYISNNGPSAEMAVLAAAILKAPNREIALLPAGSARIEKVAELTVQSHGRSAHVTQYAIIGLAFTPQTVWLDDTLHFFGSPGKWSALLKEGWEHTNDQLYNAELKSDDERYRKMAASLARFPSHPIAFTHVRTFDSQNAVMREDQTVLVSKDRIIATGPSSSISIPADAELIDGHGKTLLPGLIDMHSHSGSLNGPLNIASGVTSVRDMGSNIEELHHLQEQWDTGATIGPHSFNAGLIDGHGPYQAPTGLFADTEQEAQAAVNRYADLGYIQIKLYSSLKPELVPGIIKTAHARGLRVSGHVPNGLTARQFVEEGADEIQHINFIFLNFFASQVKDTRTPERFTAVGANAAKLDLDSEPVRDFIKLLKARGATVDVTLATFEPMFRGRPKQISPDLAPVLSRMPAQVQRFAYNGGLPVTPATDQLYKDSYRAMLRMTKKMYDAGIPILAGTDALAGFMLHRELELEVEAGIPPAKALQIATYNAAHLLKQDVNLGSIAAGKQADLLLIEGNPAKNISDIRRCRTVLKGGAVYDSNAIYAALGIKPAL
jgi:imidazolonepropionase-like amidohydrolase